MNHFVWHYQTFIRYLPQIHTHTIAHSGLLFRWETGIWIWDYDTRLAVCHWYLWGYAARGAGGERRGGASSSRAAETAATEDEKNGGPENSQWRGRQLAEYSQQLWILTSYQYIFLFPPQSAVVHIYTFHSFSLIVDWKFLFWNWLSSWKNMHAIRFIILILWECSEIHGPLALV